jgi:hypothetical protein
VSRELGRNADGLELLHLPADYTPELVRDALAAKIKTLPEVLRASLTWDQGPEMGKWKQVSVDADTSSSVTRTRRGSAPRMRTQTACCANTFRRAATSPLTAPTTSTESLPNSTIDHADA